LNPPRRRALAPTAAALALLIAGASAHAQSEEAPASSLPLWELGVFAFGVSQQAYPGSDEQLARGLLLPFGQYRGRFLRADRDTAGLRAVKTPVYEVDIGVAGSFGGSSAEIGARRGMPELGTLIEFGPRLKINLGSWGEGRHAGRWRVELPLRGVFDISDGAAHRGMSFEPEINFQRRSLSGWGYGVSLGAIVGDKRLNRTFYGVDPVYALPDRPAYAAQSGLISWRLSGSLSRQLTPDWRLVTFARWASVAGAANEASPLVRRTNGLSVGFGLSYTWLRSEARANE
jgi:outer membrane scaffolding protein for murein synthesis (MipA/OmpV family)